MYAGTAPRRGAACPLQREPDGRRVTPERAREVAAWVCGGDPGEDTRGSAGYKRAVAAVWAERMLVRLADEEEAGR